MSLCLCVKLITNSFEANNMVIEASKIQIDAFKFFFKETEGTHLYYNRANIEIRIKHTMEEITFCEKNCIYFVSFKVYTASYLIFSVCCFMHIKHKFGYISNHILSYAC